MISIILMKMMNVQLVLKNHISVVKDSVFVMMGFIKMLTQNAKFAQIIAKLVLQVNVLAALNQIKDS